MGRPKTHGLTGQRILSTWTGMMARCYDKNVDSYKYCGARGITVCAEWHDAAIFAAWARTHGYTDELTIDRIDNNGNYEPNNVRFVTSRENARNKRNNNIVTIFGESKLLIEWSEDPRCAVTYKTLHKRIVMRGWEPEIALTTPNLSHGLQQAKLVEKSITAFGETKLISEWTSDTRCVVDYGTLNNRLKRGWLVEDAITAPTNTYYSYERKVLL